MTTTLVRVLTVAIIRNWGDEAVVNQEDVKSWASMIQSDHTFWEKFVKVSLLSPEKRHEKVLVTEDYLVGMDKVCHTFQGAISL
jgi:hypothetical protein